MYSQEWEKRRQEKKEGRKLEAVEPDVSRTEVLPSRLYFPRCDEYQTKTVIMTS